MKSNKTMGNINQKNRQGFTIIEVVIFLAITGLLILGVIIGTGSTIARHRYDDSVQNLAELLRAEYSRVINPQISEREKAVLCDATAGPPNLETIFNGEDGSNKNNGFDDSFYETLFDKDGNFVGIPGSDDTSRGRTNCAVYGVIVELDGPDLKTRPLVGRDYAEIEKEYTASYIPGSDAPAFENLSDIELLSWAGITGGFAYVTARPICSGNAEAQERCREEGLSLEDMEYPQNYECGVSFSPPPSSISTRLEWRASMLFRSLNPDGSVNDLDATSKTLLIFRSPKNGTVRTYVLNGSLSVTSITIDSVGTFDLGEPVFVKFNNSGSGNCQGNLFSGGQINQGNFDNAFEQLSVSGKLQAELGNIKTEDVIICVDSPDIFATATSRRMINLIADGHNSSAVELIDMDSEENICNL